MGAIVIRQKRNGAVPLGVSKLFGSPDVPNAFEWPAVIDSANCYDLDFICQINCSELALHDKRGVLPSKGMLYFFYDIAKSSGDVGDKNSARVVYTCDTQLDELMMVDGEGRDCAICPPKALSFSHAASKAEKPTMLLPLSTDVEEGYTAIFCISSFRVENAALRFTNVGRLYFLVKTESLERYDFSDVRTKIVLENA